MARRRFEAFGVVSVLAGMLFLTLSVNAVFYPAALAQGFGLTPSEGLAIMVRRAGVMMLGFAVLLLLVRSAPPSPVRRAISLTVAVTMAGFAAAGTRELLRGALDPSVWGAVAVEAAFAVAFLALWLAEWRAAGAERRGSVHGG